MKLWPWNKYATEARSSGGGYESGILSAFEAQAAASPRAQSTAALEAASSLVARCLASATVEGPPRLAAAVTPAVLAQAGRSLIRQGEQVFEVDVSDAGLVRLLVAGHHDVYGGADPLTWTYRTSVYGPGGTTTRHLPAAGVVHVRYLVDPARPWCGVAPLRAASISGRLSAEVSQALADAESGPRGALMPLPVDGEDPTVEKLRADLRHLRGELALVESVKTMHAGAAGNAPAGDWKQMRIGADPPAAEVELLGRAFTEVASACGCPAVLFSERGDGTARREAFRQFMHSTLEPIARLISLELSEKLEAPIALNLDRLYASDLAGRARAFGSLVKGGMELDKAAALAGLLGADD